MSPARILLLAPALWLAVGAAQAEAPDAAEGARKLYAVAGLEGRVAAIEGRVLQRVKAEPNGPSADELARVGQAVSTAYSSEALKQRILARLEAGYDPAKAQEVFAWYDTDLGEKVRELDEKGSTVNFETIQKYAESLSEQPPPEDRATLIRRYDVATGATANGVEVAIGTGVGFQLALDAATRKPLDGAAIRAQGDAQRPRLFQMFQAINLAGLLYTYRSLSDADLIETVRFAESDAGRWYFDATGSAFGDSVAAASTQLEEELSDAAKSGQ